MSAWQDAGPAPYPSGLRLHGRRVVVVGGGSAAQRRVPALLGAGADVVVVAPWVTPALEGLAGSGEVGWRRRALDPADLDEAWYVVAAAGDPDVDAATRAVAEDRRLFCEQVDRPDEGTAWAPTVGRHGGVTVGVHGALDPRRLAEVRDRLVEHLRGSVAPGPATLPGVVLVGGGPGHPDLVTVAGRRALAEADVVVADRLAPRELLSELAPDVEIVDVAKLPRGRSSTQEEINRVLVDRVRRGKRVVRFKGGDSFVFGRGGEEVQACAAAGIPCSVVPGLSSALSVPGLAGIPVTHRGVAHEFTVVSGHVPPEDPSSLVDWDALARLRGTLVLLMAVENLPAIADRLARGGRSLDTPVAVLVEGSLPGERRLLSTLGEVAVDVRREGVRPPAIVVVGPVVAVAHPDRYSRPDAPVAVAG
ncbi:MAG TPA: uroporphyrinogen-III C-methyltransferase [Nocardioidaceae bacterium]